MRGVVFVWFLLALCAKGNLVKPGDRDNPSTLFRVEIQNAASRLAVANDGSPGIYYFRPGTDPTRWLFYLEGGWWCDSLATCKDRWQTQQFLMTSKLRGPTITGTGVLSANTTINPDFATSTNIVYMAYVTSDAYVGNSSAQESGTPWQYRGRVCLKSIIEDLVNGFTVNGQTYNMKQAKQFLFSGDSAGGVGAVLNADFVHDFVRELLPDNDVSVRAMPDSGYFTSTLPPYRAGDCQGPNIADCSLSNSMAIGYNLWKARPQLDPDCVKGMQAAGQPLSHCLWPQISKSFSHTDQMHVMFNNDAAEIEADVGQVDSQSMTYIMELANTRRDALNTSAAFLPSCYHHVMTLDDRNMQGLIITPASGTPITLQQAIHDWYFNNVRVSHIDQCDTFACNPTCPAN